MEIDIQELGQIALRVSVIYLIVLMGLRLLGKREIAQLSVVNFVLVLLISNAVQNAMFGPDTTLWGGIAAALVLFGINFILKLLENRSAIAKRLLEGSPQVLIYKGKVNALNLRRAHISMEALNAVMREHGINAIDQVDLSMLEVNGNISVLSGNFTVYSENRRYKERHK